MSVFFTEVNINRAGVHLQLQQHHGADPVLPSRFVPARGYVNSGSSALQQQANEIIVECSLQTTLRGAALMQYQHLPVKAAAPLR